jgi:hypothetical protein
MSLLIGLSILPVSDCKQRAPAVSVVIRRASREPDQPIFPFSRLSDSKKLMILTSEVVAIDTSDGPVVIQTGHE